MMELIRDFLAFMIAVVIAFLIFLPLYYGWMYLYTNFFA